MTEDTPPPTPTWSVWRAVRVPIAVCAALAIFAIAGAAAAAIALRMSVALPSRDSASAAVLPSAPATPTAPPVDWKRAGRSVQGRPILEAVFGSGRRRILVIGGIHGSEFGADVAEQFAAWLTAAHDVVPAGTQVVVVACANPDGRAAGKKGNAHAVNLNGNFPTSNWKPQEYLTTTAGPRAGSEPETQVITRMLGTGYARVVSLHSQGGFIDYDGPGASALATEVASASGSPIKKLLPATAYAGSLGTYVPERFGIPMLTFELSSRTMTPAVLEGLLTAIR